MAAWRIESGSPPRKFAWRIKARSRPGKPDWNSQDGARSVRAMIAMIDSFRARSSQSYVYVKRGSLLLFSCLFETKLRRTVSGTYPSLPIEQQSRTDSGQRGRWCRGGCGISGISAEPRSRRRRRRHIESFRAQAPHRIDGHHQNPSEWLSRPTPSCRHRLRPQDLDGSAVNRRYFGAMATMPRPDSGSTKSPHPEERPEAASRRGATP
jgi:hypothetical protein